MDIATYFNMMTKLMSDIAPPASEDSAQLEKMAKIGIIPGEKFDINKLSSEIQKVMHNVNSMAMERINAEMTKNGGVTQNGWLIPTATGTYGSDYLTRATIAAFGWPANFKVARIYTCATENKQPIYSLAIFRLN